MKRIVEIKTRPNIPVYFCDAGEYPEIKLGEEYIIEIAEDEEDIGTVINGPFQVEDSHDMTNICFIKRKALDSDKEIYDSYRQKEPEAFNICREKIREHELPIKLVAAHYLSGGKKLKFYFTADGRIDFRELVRDLAHIFKTRIEMRQIGARDEARMIGGYGICGLPLCCKVFLRKLDPISVKMAKDQGLPLNPSKISGICGRLMCCLFYEYNIYKEALDRFPKLGSTVQTPSGEGTVIQNNIPKETVMVKIGEGCHEFALSEVTPLKETPGEAVVTALADLSLTEEEAEELERLEEG